MEQTAVQTAVQTAIQTAIHSPTHATRHSMPPSTLAPLSTPVNIICIIIRCTITIGRVPNGAPKRPFKRLIKRPRMAQNPGVLFPHFAPLHGGPERLPLLQRGPPSSSISSPVQRAHRGAWAGPTPTRVSATLSTQFFSQAVPEWAQTAIQTALQTALQTAQDRTEFRSLIPPLGASPRRA